MLRLAKQHRDQLLVDFVVFCEQDSQRPSCRSWSRQRRARRFRAPHSRKAEKLCKGVEQGLLADRFRQHRIDNGGGDFREAVPTCRRGYHDLCLGKARRRPNSVGQCFTRKARHHLVYDDEVERFALMKGPLQFGHCGEPIIGRRRLDAKAGQLTRQNAPVHLDIVDDQDIKTRQFAG